MKHEYRPVGICPRLITVNVEDGILKDVEFVGGCNGNLKGVAALAKGMPVAELEEKLAGIKCGFKDSSCPDQLVKAAKAALEKMD